MYKAVIVTTVGTLGFNFEAAFFSKHDFANYITWTYRWMHINQETSHHFALQCLHPVLSTAPRKHTASHCFSS
jgi:hypothetical protein